MVFDTCKNPYPFEDMLLCVPLGWRDLLRYCYLIADYHNLTVLQVKEKWGGLRFYVSSAPEQALDMIGQAETLSLSTCGECGVFLSPNQGTKTPVGHMLCPICIKNQPNFELK